MKDKLLREIELRLSLQLPVEQREKAMQCVISALNDYDVTERVTDVTVRHEDINERILKRYVACIRIDGKAESTIKQYVRTLIKLAELIGKPYTEMSAYDIRYFLGDIKARGSKNSHVENQRSYVSTFFQWMFDEEMIQKNPCAKIKTIKVESEVRLPFSAVEIDRMRSVCSRPLDREDLEEEDKKKVKANILRLLQEKYGKNAVLKGMNLLDGGMTVERNGQIGGHRAGDQEGG